MVTFAVTRCKILGSPTNITGACNLHLSVTSILFHQRFKRTPTPTSTEDDKAVHFPQKKFDIESDLMQYKSKQIAYIDIHDSRKALRRTQKNVADRA